MQAETKRFLDPNIPDEMAATIRPHTLSDFIGHDALKQNLSVFINGAKSRGEAMDHVLLYGPRDWARRHWRTLWQMNWERISVRRPRPC